MHRPGRDYRSPVETVSDDGSWRVVAYQALDTVSTVEFFGPRANGYHGKHTPSQARWTKPLGCAQATLSTDGEFVLASGDLEHPENGIHTSGLACFSDLPSFVYGRDGRLVLRWPANGDPAELAAAVLARTGKPLRLPPVRDPLLWGAPDQPGERTDTRIPNSPRQHSPDGQLQVTAYRGTLRLYRAPEPAP